MISEIEKIMELMQKYTVDRVKIGDLEISKKIHTHPEASDTSEAEQESDEDLLFYSSEV